MKVILQPFEPMPQPIQVSHENAQSRPQAMAERKPRMRFQPAASETRLFHAL